jgi:hypothetical protein
MSGYGWKSLDFFSSSVVSSLSPGTGATLQGDRVTAVEPCRQREWYSRGECRTTGGAYSGTAGGSGKDRNGCDPHMFSIEGNGGSNPGVAGREVTFYVGTQDGLVHRVEVEEGADGRASGFRVEGSFPALDMDHLPGDTSGKDEVFRIGYVSRVPIARSGSFASARSSSSGRSPSTASTTMTLGRKLYAAIGESAVSKNAVEEVVEGLVVAGYSKKNISLRVWDLSSTGSGMPPASVAQNSVFRNLKLLDSDIECIDVDIAEYPRVFVAVGTVSGSIKVYCCDRIDGREQNNGIFTRICSMDAKMMVTAQDQGHHYANRVHQVLFVRTGKHQSQLQELGNAKESTAAIKESKLFVWGVSERGGVVGFDAFSENGGCDLAVRDEVLGTLKKRCVSVDEKGDLVLASGEGIFSCTLEEGRTIAASIKGGEKQSVFAVGGGYILLASAHKVGGSHEENRISGPLRPSKIQIVHLERKILGFTMLMESPVVVVHWNKGSTRSSGQILYVLDGNGSLHQLRENSLESHIQKLCSSKLFPQALQLCEQVGEAGSGSLCAEINRQYGDHLISIGEFDFATDAYIKTIGILETSYVIEKLMGVQESRQLTRYLMELFNRNLANGDHISLLIQLYTNSNDDSSIRDLVSSACLRKHDLGDALDTKAVIDILRRSGYIEHALNIAKDYGENESYISILLDEERDLKQALDFLRSQPRAFAAEQLTLHGKLLIENEAVATTALLIEICTNSRELRGGDGEEADLFVADITKYAQLYSNNHEDLQYACLTVLELGSPSESSKKQLYHTLIDMNLMNQPSVECGTGQSDKTDLVMDLLERGWPPGHEPAYDPDVVLASCVLNKYHKGNIFINKRMRRYREVIAAMAEEGDWRAMIDICLRHGKASTGGDPLVWQDSLAAMSSPEAKECALSHLGDLLEAIVDAGALPPLTVLGILVQNPGLNFGTVKDYFIGIIQDDYDKVQEYSAEIEELTKKIERTRQSLGVMEENPVMFQSTTDSSTGATLDIPSVHFMCGHSFNAEGLSDPYQKDKDEVNIKCPLCAEDQDRIQALVSSFKDSSVDKDTFFRQLEASDDCFGFISDAFGRGFAN